MDGIGVEHINLNTHQLISQSTEKVTTQESIVKEYSNIVKENKKDSLSGQESQENKVIKAIEEANKKINKTENEFSFSVHEGTKQIMIKVINKNTKEIIKEFPPEKILDMVAAMCETAGLFVDEKR